MDRFQRIERSAVSILLFVGLLTFFFPLVTFQIPVLGNQSLSGYDMFSRARELNEQLSTKRSEEANVDFWQSASEPSQTEASSKPPLPNSVQFAALVPLEASLGIASVVLAIPGCFPKFKPRYVMMLSIVGSVASVIAILHLTVINSDLHTWFRRSMSEPSLNSGDNPFFGFAQELGKLVANSFQGTPGAGLYALAVTLILVAFLSYSRLLGGTQAAEIAAEGTLNVVTESLIRGDDRPTRNPLRIRFVFVVAMMLVMVGVVVIVLNWPWESPTTSPVISGYVKDIRPPAVSLLNPSVNQGLERHVLLANRVLDGKIAEHFASRDDVGMMRQLGLLPPPPSLSDE